MNRAFAHLRSEHFFTSLFALCCALGCEDCYKQRAVDSVPDLPYPTCAESGSGSETILVEGAIQAGPLSREASVFEEYRLTQRDCHYVLTSRQAWAKGVADVEVIYDLDWTPLRAWKRTLSPEFEDPDSQADIRRYELRTTPATMTVRDPDGTRRFAELVGPKPTAVIGPGRASLVPWIRRARLSADEVSSEDVLDFRSLGVEKIDRVALRRDPDREVNDAGGNVRVYTVYGRESVFVDDSGAVVGDLAGMRPHAPGDPNPPEPAVVGAAPDPRNTP